MEEKRLSNKQMIGYGIGSIGENISYTVFYSFFLFFLTNVAGLSAAQSGIVSMLAVVWDAITDPAVGYISDHSRNKKGRRRPIIAKFCFVLGAAIFLMFTDLRFLSQDAKFIYFVAVNILFYLALTCCDIPYLSFAAELEATPESRTKLRSVAAMCLQAGMLLASAGMLPLVNLFGRGNDALGYSLAGLVMGVFACLAYFVMVVATRGLEPPNPNLALPKEKVSAGKAIGDFFKSFGSVFTFKPFVILLVLTFFVWFSENMQQSALMYFCTYNAGMTDAQITVQYLYVGIACAITPYFTARITNRFGKKKTAIWGLGVTGIAMLAMNFVTPWNITYVYIFRTLAIVVMSIWYVTIYSMVYDVSDYDEAEHGVRREGMMQSMFQFSIKLATAVSMLLVGVIIGAYGYDANAAVQTATALGGIRDVTMLWPAVAQLIAVVVIFIYPVSNKKMHEVAAILKERKAAKKAA